MVTKSRVVGWGVSLLALAFQMHPAGAAEVPQPDAGMSAPAVSSIRTAGTVLLAAKFGGIAPFNGLRPFPTFGLEVGYPFGGTHGLLATLLTAEYRAPSAQGSTSEAFSPDRIPGGTYSWELRQKELVLQPTLMYRLPGVLSERLTPYAAFGPRIYFLESVVRGQAGGVAFRDTPERSTKLGVGLPLGAELQLGPGGLFAELLLQWAPVNHTTTGDSHLGGMALFAGYRAAL